MDEERALYLLFLVIAVAFGGVALLVIFGKNDKSKGNDDSSKPWFHGMDDFND